MRPHYHELTELEGKLPGVNNYCIAVQEKGDSIIFLRKIIKGSADRSYGIQVAKLAGVPEVVIERAKEIAAELEESDITANTKILERNVQKKPSQFRFHYLIRWEWWQNSQRKVKWKKH